MEKRKGISVFCYVISLILYGMVFHGLLAFNDGLSFFGLFILILPIPSFIVALILQAKNAWLKWLYPFLFGLFGFVMWSLMLGVTSMGFLTSFLPSLIGAWIGLKIWKKSKDV